MDQQKPNLVIWGASGHARVVADIVQLEGRYRLTGFIDDVDSRSRLFLGLPVFGSRDILPRLKEDGVSHIIIGIGNCEARLKLSALARQQGLYLAKAVHPGAIIAGDVTIGVGTVVAAGAVVNPGASIGESVIINTKASVDHDCTIADGAHLCPGTTLGGAVTVGSAAWIGIGSTVRDHVSIGDRTLIGAGSVVVGDIPDGVVAYGVPARIRGGS